MLSNFDLFRAMGCARLIPFSMLIHLLDQQSGLGVSVSSFKFKFYSFFPEVLVRGWSVSMHSHRNSPQRAKTSKPVQLQTIHIQEPLHQGFTHSSSQVSVAFTPQ